MKNLLLDEDISIKIFEWLTENGQMLIDMNKTCVHEIILSDDKNNHYKCELRIKAWGDYGR